MCGQFYLYIKRESPFLENYSVLNFELVEIIFGKIFSIAIPEFPNQYNQYHDIQKHRW